jgi:hypothetical protein
VVDRDDQLPILGQEPVEEPERDAPSCAPKIYVSMEESSLLQAMRDIKERAAMVRNALAEKPPSEARAELEAQMDGYRKQFFELSQRRERAYLRKMVMLGHIPPSALDG